MIMYILTFTFLEKRWEGKRLKKTVASIPQI